MTIVPINLGLQSEPSRYGPATGARFINAFAEEAGTSGKIQYPVYPIEGLSSFATLSGGGTCRGAIDVDGVAYVISGTLVFKVESGGGVTQIGAFPGTDPAFMARNRKSTPQVAIASAGLRYIIENDVVSTISDTDLPNANSVTYIDGYFVWSMDDGRFFISAIDEGTSIDALDFATAEASPDGLLVAYARGRELLLFGPKSVEFWANTGAAAFPFERIPGTFLRGMGLLCRHSVADLNDVVFFVATDGTVRRFNGYSPERISHHAVERDIDNTSNKATIRATAYSVRGHQFYCLSSATWSWVYDGLTGLWHERESYNRTRWKGEVFVSINGVPVIGDSASAILHQIDADVFDESGDHLVWKVRLPPVHDYPNRVIFNRLFLDVVPGTGLISGTTDETDPNVMLRWSDDGGKTWSDERTAAVGTQGEFSKRVVFSELGESGEDGRMFELSMSAAVARGLTGASADIDVVEP